MPVMSPADLLKFLDESSFALDEKSAGKELRPEAVAVLDAALAALEDEAWMLASVARVRTERARVAAALKALGLRVADSQTNFLFFECRSDSAEQAAALLRQGIIVKAWREAGYERFMRATIGSAQDNDRLLAALAVLNPV